MIDSSSKKMICPFDGEICDKKDVYGIYYHKKCKYSYSISENDQYSDEAFVIIHHKGLYSAEVNVHNNRHKNTCEIYASRFGDYDNTLNFSLDCCIIPEDDTEKMIQKIELYMMLK